MFKSIRLWCIWMFGDVATGHVYKTRGGAIWHITVEADDVLVHWTATRVGPYYRIPKIKWFAFADGTGAKLVDIR